MKSKDFLKELAAYADSLRQKVEAQFDGWNDTPEAVVERRKKVFDPVSGYDFLCLIIFRIMCAQVVVRNCTIIFLSNYPLLFSNPHQCI
ncbi:Uncharacterised protein [Rodentibacter pneumotropicus]|uniref:Uncharacterized protein n=1 Tax=Rodentibacter pneumotropicus TaxID=758 RepID=A0A3S4VZW5_9PAST|nr:Uncharacterised protein [Rodentibacter pneumotropicus]